MYAYGLNIVHLTARVVAVTGYHSSSQLLKAALGQGLIAAWATGYGQQADRARGPKQDRDTEVGHLHHGLRLLRRHKDSSWMAIHSDNVLETEEPQDTG